MIGHLHPVVVGPPLKSNLNPSKQTSTTCHQLDWSHGLAIILFSKFFHHTQTSGETSVVERIRCLLTKNMIL